MAEELRPHWTTGKVSYSGSAVELMPCCVPHLSHTKAPNLPHIMSAVANSVRPADFSQ